jgi:hypothetical protein
MGGAVKAFALFVLTIGLLLTARPVRAQNSKPATLDNYLACLDGTYECRPKALTVEQSKEVDLAKQDRNFQNRKEGFVDCDPKVIRGPEQSLAARAS